MALTHYFGFGLYNSLYYRTSRDDWQLTVRFICAAINCSWIFTVIKGKNYRFTTVCEVDYTVVTQLKLQTIKR